jgi:hypothetical protein
VAGLFFGSIFTIIVARWMVINNFAVLNGSRRFHLLPRPLHPRSRIASGKYSKLGKPSQTGKQERRADIGEKTAGA